MLRRSKRVKSGMRKKRLFVIESHKGYRTVKHHINPQDFVVTNLGLEFSSTKQPKIIHVLDAGDIQCDQLLIYTTDETYNSLSFKLVSFLRKLKKEFRVVLLDHHSAEGRFHKNSRAFWGLSKGQL